MRWVYLRRPTLRWIIAALIIITALILIVVALTVRRDEPENLPESRQELAEQAAEDMTHYDLEITFLPEENRLDGVLSLDYVNGESRPVDTLYFFVWPNSFTSLDYAVFEGEEDRAYPNGFSRGELTVGGITAGGDALNWELQGEQQQVLMVSLPAAVAAGERTQIIIEYEVTVPECYGRFGHGEDTWSLVNAHPILAVCDDETGQWYNDYPYYSIGDPFYSDAADYTARIHVPVGYMVAATGSQTTRKGDDEWVTTTHGPAQRDFGFVVSDHFEVIEETVGDITVRSWYYGSDWLGQRAADAAAAAVRIFSERYGDYCWDELDVVMCDFYIGGMEYPGMVLIDQSTYTLTTAMTMEMIVAHEVGHQWWYAAVGSNQILEPWMDEGLTEFSTAVYFEDGYASHGEEYRDRLVYDSYDWMESLVTVADGAAINSPVTDFISNYDYSLVVYGRGAHMFDDLRSYLGEEVFYEALSNYYHDYTFKLAEGDDLIEAFNQASGQDLTDWFSQYMK